MRRADRIPTAKRGSPLRLAILAFVLAGQVGASSGQESPLGPEVRQLIVSVAPDWNAMRGTLQCFEREANGPWRPASGPVPVLYGGRGLAWGRGVPGAMAGDDAVPRKVEGDGRSPAGIFAIGIVYTDDASLPEGCDFPFHQVTEADAWIDDPAHPQYNRHVVVDPQQPPPWFERQRMRLGDPAFRWLIEVRHNADPPVVGAGSAIFIHTRRGPDRTTAGCTAMAEEDLVQVLRWLRAAKEPHFLLLPQSEYALRAHDWNLPPPPEPSRAPAHDR